MVGRQFAEVVVLNVDWPFDKPLDSTQMRALGGVAERIGHAFRAGSGRPSNPVDIAFRFVWQLEIDDMGDTVDVDAARGDVGCDKNPQPVGFKSVQGPLTGCLRFVAVNGRGLDTGLAQLLCHPVRPVLGPREDDDPVERRVRQKVLQQRSFLSRGNMDNPLFNPVRRHGFRCDVDPHRREQDIVGELRDFFRHRGRKEKCLALFRHSLHNLTNIVNKTHVEHAVRFV